MPAVPPDSLVVLTGASGFLAKHVARRLLAEGYRVRATLRTPAREAEVRAAVLPGLAPEAGERLGFATCDLGSDAGWDAAMAGAQALVHTASPFPLEQPRDPEVLVRPAVDGARRALRAAAGAGVARVVLTSSSVAVVSPGATTPQDERDWADPDAPRIRPYERSKILAERAAWALAGELGLALTVINPGLILGPLLDATSGTSVGIVARILAGRDPMMPDLRFETVDVRDAAEAHLRALARPESAGERVLAVAGPLSMPEMARVLKATHPSRRIATRRAPDWLIRALAVVQADLRPALPMLGRSAAVSNAKAKALLGLDFIAPEEAARATARSLIDLGLV